MNLFRLNFVVEINYKYMERSLCLFASKHIIRVSETLLMKLLAVLASKNVKLVLPWYKFGPDR